MCWRLFNDHNIFVNLLQIINLWIQFLFIWRFLLDSMHDELLFELFVRFLQLFTDSTKLWIRIKLNFWIHMCRVLCACSSAGVMGCIPVQWNFWWWPAMGVESFGACGGLWYVTSLVWNGTSSSTSSSLYLKLRNCLRFVCFG